MSLVGSITAELGRYRAQADAAIAQLDGADVTRTPAEGSNSIAVIGWHLAGNLRSRFTDFLTTDGEKPWRQRDEEFEPRAVTRAELQAHLNDGWDVLFATLAGLTDNDLNATVTIRSQPLLVHEALHRALAHVASHVGQIVYLAKSFRGAAWTSLSIPRGQSTAFNRRMQDRTR